MGHRVSSKGVNRDAVIIGFVSCRKHTPLAENGLVPRTRSSYERPATNFGIGTLAVPRALGRGGIMPQASAAAHKSASAGDLPREFSTLGVELFAKNSVSMFAVRN